MLQLVVILLLSLFGQSYSTELFHYSFNAMPNEALTTFFIDHSKDDKSIFLNFYEVREIYPGETPAIIGQVQIDRDSNDAATVTSMGDLVNGVWLESKSEKLSIDGIAPEQGLWRIDLIRLDGNYMAVFFQGFYAGVRVFRVPIDKMQSVYVLSGSESNNTPSNVTMETKWKANTKSGTDFYYRFTDIIDQRMGEDSEKPRAEEWRDPIVYGHFPMFQQHTSINMTVLLRTSGNAQNLVPILGLRKENTAKKDKAWPLAIVHKWEGGSPIIRLVRIDAAGAWVDQVVCSNEKPMGDLQHVLIERVSANDITMTIFYTRTEGAAGSKCSLTLTDSTGLDGPLELVGVDAAMVLHLADSIPRAIEKPKIVNLNPNITATTSNETIELLSPNATAAPGNETVV